MHNRLPPLKNKPACPQSACKQRTRSSASILAGRAPRHARSHVHAAVTAAESWQRSHSNLLPPVYARQVGMLSKGTHPSALHVFTLRLLFFHKIKARPQRPQRYRRGARRCIRAGRPAAAAARPDAGCGRPAASLPAGPGSAAR